MSTKQTLGLALALIVIIGAITFLEREMPMRPSAGPAEKIAIAFNTEKRLRYPAAAELAGISGYHNTEGNEINIADLVGKKVILIDFWTYSCINCQRTLPYLTAWYDKYREAGLEIVGVHTPEFNFEKDYDNVQTAIEKWGIAYPVVQDNDYATWTAYGNRYWPHKYLIDIDGYIVYDHIGEGGYDETEKQIQKLLSERMARLGEQGGLAQGTVKPDALVAGEVNSPEIYFGAFRNELLANGKINTEGVQSFEEPSSITLNKLYLVGDWNITREYAEAASENAKVIYRYSSQDVYAVVSSETERQVGVTRDGSSVGSAAGSGVRNGSFRVQEEDLYRIIQDTQAGEHTLEFSVPQGVRFYTFTFG